MLHRASRLAVRSVQGRVLATPAAVSRVTFRSIETDSKKQKGAEKKATPPPAQKAAGKAQTERAPLHQVWEKIELPLSYNGVVTAVLEPVIPILYESGKDKTVRSELKGLSELTLRDPFSWDKIHEVYKQNQFKNSNFSKVTQMILAELGRRNQLKSIPKVSETLEEIMKQLNNEHSVRVTLPVEPTAEQVAELKEELFVHLFKADPSVKIDLTVDVNPAIIAGRVYHFRDGMLNMSAGQYLEQYKDNRLTERKDEDAAAAKAHAKLLQPLSNPGGSSNKKYLEYLQAE